MTTLRPIDIKPYAGLYGGGRPDVGQLPELRYIAITKLRVDAGYQRDIGRRGKNNIIAIARGFRWAKFSTIIVAPADGGLYVIIDGQHHVTAAALRGIKEVPCQVVFADRREQADAFAAVNGNVTAMTSLQLHAARLVAGEPKAVALAEACGAADVSICRYPVPANKMKAGETLAVGMLQKVFDKYGRDVFVAALCCITRTRKGNVGMIRAQIVEALCSVLEAEPEWWEDDKRLVKAMQTFDFAARYNAARSGAINGEGTITDLLVDAVGSHLESKLGTSA